MGIPATNQIPWTRANNIGHSFYRDENPIDQPKGTRVSLNGERIDHTEAFGALDSIQKAYRLGPRNLDIGGGQFDFNTAYLWEKYDIKQMVYDPFKRTNAHNLKILDEAKERPFDTVTSISILNVISNEKALRAHIQLTRDTVKEGGKVFFKVWPNNGSGVPSNVPEEGWQSNRRLENYVEDITNIFGSKNVKLDRENQLIVAVKNLN